MATHTLLLCTYIDRYVYLTYFCSNSFQVLLTPHQFEPSIKYHSTPIIEPYKTILKLVLIASVFLVLQCYSCVIHYQAKDLYCNITFESSQHQGHQHADHAVHGQSSSADPHPLYGQSMHCKMSIVVASGSLV